MIGSLEGVEWGVLFRGDHGPIAAGSRFRRALPAAPHRGPDRGRHQRITGGYRPWASTERNSCRPCGGRSRSSRASTRCPDHRLRRFDRGFCGWTQLVGNYEHSLDSMLPGYAQHSQAMLSTLSTWDSAATGPSTGATPQARHEAPRRHTERHHQTSHVPQARSGPSRVLLHVQAEANELRLSETDVRSIGFSMISRRATPTPIHGASCRI